MTKARKKTENTRRGLLEAIERIVRRQKEYLKKRKWHPEEKKEIEKEGESLTGEEEEVEEDEGIEWDMDEEG